MSGNIPTATTTAKKSKKKHKEKERDKERDEEKSKKANSKSKKAAATASSASKTVREPSPARARTRSAKTLSPWETELERRKTAGLDMDLDFLNNHKELFQVDPSPFSDVNLEEILLGPGGTVSVTFVDVDFIDRWAIKDNVSWAKGGDTLPNLALLLTLTNDAGVASYGATLVWVSAHTARTTVARAINSLSNKLKEADGPLVLCVLCDTKTVPTYCPYPPVDFIVIPLEVTEDGVGDLSVRSKSSSRRELQTKLDRGRTGHISFTPQQISKKSSFQSQILHKKFGRKVEDLTEESDDECVILDDTDEKDQKPPANPGVSGYKADNKRPHPPSPDSPEESGDDDSTGSIEYCSDAGELGSEHQEESDCPPVV